MSKKIDFILEVLEIIQQKYVSDRSQPLEDVRVAATTIVAKRYSLWRTTILDTYQRRLKPDTYGTESFDELVKDWLINKSLSLQTILLRHSVDETDERKIAKFFREANPELSNRNETAAPKANIIKKRNLYVRMQRLTRLIEERAEYDERFDPSTINDERIRVAGELVQRRGQRRFRDILIALYDEKCAISGTNVSEALEAAHIIPYLGDETDHPTNGLLLRADIHNLFDFGLIAINEVTYSIIVSETLRGSSYEEYHGQKLYLPKNEEFWPNREALRQHREEAQLIFDTNR